METQRELTIVTGTTTDFPSGSAPKGVVIIPETMQIGTTTYTVGKDTSLPWLYEKFAQGIIPQTSSPGIAPYISAFKQEFDEGKEVLAIFPGRKLSSIYDHASVSAKEVDEKGERISVFDSGSTSFGIGYLVEAAARLQDEGQTREEIEKYLTAARNGIRIVVALQQMRYAVAGGRIPGLNNRFGQAVGDLVDKMGIKALVDIVDGKTSNEQFVRSPKQLESAMTERLIINKPYRSAMVAYAPSEIGPDGKHVISNEAMIIAQALQRFGCDPVPISIPGPIMIAHGGPGLVAAITFNPST